MLQFTILSILPLYHILHSLPSLCVPFSYCIPSFQCPTNFPSANGIFFMSNFSFLPLLFCRTESTYPVVFRVFNLHVLLQVSLSSLALISTFPIRCINLFDTGLFNCTGSSASEIATQPCQCMSLQFRLLKHASLGMWFGYNGRN